jgi:hypothetical protein
MNLRVPPDPANEFAATKGAKSPYGDSPRRRMARTRRGGEPTEVGLAPFVAAALAAGLQFIGPTHRRPAGPVLRASGWIIELLKCFRSP